MPYTVEHNDIPVMMIHQHQSDYWLTRLTKSFDQLYEESLERVKVMAVAIHPYISGQPHRISYLKKAFDDFARFEGVCLERMQMDELDVSKAGLTTVVRLSVGTNPHFGNDTNRLG